MSKMIKSVFAEATHHLPIDKELIRKIKTYAIYFVNKNQDHICVLWWKSIRCSSYSF